MSFPEYTATCCGWDFAADGFGFEALFMHCWRIRERVLDLFEKTTGGRVIFSVCKVGGVRKDIDKETLDEMVTVLRGMEKELKELTDTFINDYSVKNRLVGIGYLSMQDAARSMLRRSDGKSIRTQDQGHPAHRKRRL